MMEFVLPNKGIKFWSILSVLLFACVSLMAQSSTELQRYQEKYPGTQMVILEETEELRIELINNELTIRERHYAKRLFLTKDAGLYREREIGYSSFSAIENVEATSYLPSGKGYKKVKTKEFKVSDDLNSSVFHDDSKIISFSFQGLQMGAMTELSYTRLVNEPHFIGRSVLQSVVPIESKTYRVIVDSGVEMEFTEYLTDQDFITYEKTENKGTTIYQWTVKNSPVVVSEKWSPPSVYYLPQVFPRIASYTLSGQTYPVLRNVGDLFNWYESFVDTVNQDSVNPMIQSMVDSITQNAPTDLEKVQRIFEWTQENVKYVAYEAGLGGFVPRSALSVCTNRYGDCKDMASTITHLLKYAGIQAHLTWIGTNDIPFTYHQLPTPSVDNHMIATYIDTDKKHYYMDATGRYLPFGMPSSFIQEQEALIRIAPGKYEIAQVPRATPQQNALTDSIAVYLEDGTFKGSATSTFLGYYKQNLEYKIEDLTSFEKAKFYKGYLRKGSNKFLPSNFKESHAYPSTHPFTITYDFSIGDYAMQNDDEIYINLNLSNFFSGDQLDVPRKNPFTFKFISELTEVVSFQIPDGYVLDYTPENIHVDNDLLKYEATYTQDGNSVVYRTKSYKKKLSYTPDEAELWNQSITHIIKSQKNVIILKKGN